MEFGFGPCAGVCGGARRVSGTASINTWCPQQAKPGLRASAERESCKKLVVCRDTLLPRLHPT
ncbi:hypothetical protein PpBr36_01623 [Pyricularia pennisetigena]|uniref:hypothetical protein n=1 Tax=Pyricularia pennisetigena TaxID=1578925 RepID=UPI00115409DC|nr:hypothetical protein PpBr36_01623 [Pyricularia pennisetigena]TLS27968.1 hypothetical protein PpBr36_01623 [Pyricularia pennisetigena]